MSQRQAAKILGCSQQLISQELATRNLSKSDKKLVTGSAATKKRRAAIAAKAAAKGITELPSEKYRVVYADPPWSYANTQPDYHTEQRDHYPVMEIADICALPVKTMVEDDAVLFLWVTSPAVA
jgi:hypothetical protein